MSHVRSPPSTLRENSTWTPKNFPPFNEKIFQERMTLIKKWYAAWNETQRWVLVEYILRQQDDDKLTVIHDLLHPVLPPPDHDFTCVLPRHLCLRIFSLLDPQSLCRAAQVSWYWKYLSECNELWRRKCLRLGWFLPTPPSAYDHIVWKRHYISCVCQLHWNPPQLPPEDPSDKEIGKHDEDGDDANKKRVKKKRIPRQPVTEGPRKPWKDPDRFPKDTHFFHSNLWDTLPLPTPLNLTASTSISPTKPSKPRSPATAPEQPPFIPPPSSLLHPTLLEKMRLGSPSSAHIQLSTINKAQSNQSISETFYGLQDSAPFPRLPPYYVHKPTDPDVNRTMYSSTGVAESANGSRHTKPRTTTSGTRPPSGRSSTSATFPSRSIQLANRSEQPQYPSSVNESKGWTSPPKGRETSALLSQPWTIPQEEEEG